jgi:uncharacterized membrane protein YgcG
MQERPPSLLGAAGVQAADAAIVLVATVLAGVDTATGQSYQVGSGIALTLIGLATAAALSAVALGLARVRKWSRTPALLTQLFVGIVGIYLVQSQRYEWGVPCLVLAVAGFAALLAPASLRALTRHPSAAGSGPAGQQTKAGQQTTAGQSAQGGQPTGTKQTSKGSQPAGGKQSRGGGRATGGKRSSGGGRPAGGRRPR